MKSFPSVFFSLTTAALSFGAHRVVLGWTERSFPRVVRGIGKRPLLAACGVVAVLPPVARSLTILTKGAFADVMLSAAMIELMFILAAALPLLILGQLARIGTPKPATRAAVDLAPAPAPALDRRRAIETIGGAAILGTTGLVFGWGATFGRHDYQVYEIPVRIPGLPKELDGYTIVQISDIHAGLFSGQREFRAGSALIRGVRPDLVVATGDLVDFDPGHAPELARALADLAPRDGVFAILGNHDYYAGADEVTAAMRAAGVSLLVNDARVIRDGFALLGVDDMWSRPYAGPGPSLARAAASVPGDMPRVLLAHQPEYFERVAGKIALQLSGHTHGGQIRPANLLMRGYVAGRYEKAGSTLYVNRGFGVAGPPARVGVPPEITKLVLVAA